ncbi:hypothetical protein SDC9_78813 [bioreactor metagenome]|uniref:Uncharacterized protein n=1 Tax=bioreactor metagenome TaxID=1076179 RepID=A0A644YWL9_9ZZZZ
MNGGEFVEASGHVQRFLKRGMVVQHEFTEYLVNAVELLKSCRTVKQNKGIRAHVKVALQFG